MILQHLGKYIFQRNHLLNFFILPKKDQFYMKSLCETFTLMLSAFKKETTNFFHKFLQAKIFLIYFFKQFDNGRCSIFGQLPFWGPFRSKCIFKSRCSSIFLKITFNKVLILLLYVKIRFLS